MKREEAVAEREIAWGAKICISAVAYVKHNKKITKEQIERIHIKQHTNDEITEKYPTKSSGSDKHIRINYY